jgi:ATP-binding protein involved in chromosome partitioning
VTIGPRQIIGFSAITSALSTADIKDVSVNIETKIAKYSTQKGVKILPEVKNIMLGSLGGY